MNYCFVVLHYKTEKDTIECINSIKKLSGNYSIVIVDNASNNGSIEVVEKEIKGCENIYILKNKKNLGFSSGNNIGYDFAKNNLKADMIIVLNNDIIIDSANFLDKVEKLYERTNFDLAGPDIESLVDHGHQNPMKDTTLTVFEIKKEILRYSLLWFFNTINIYDLIKKKNNFETVPVAKTNIIKVNDMLHGAFVIFSKNFISREDYCFRPGTFLYMEEAILFKYCLKKGYKMVYDPELHVLHKEDSSTNSLFSVTKDKRNFVFLNMIKSLKVYLKLLKEVEEESNE